MNNRSAVCPPLGEAGSRANLQRVQKKPHPSKVPQLPHRESLQSDAKLITPPVNTPAITAQNHNANARLRALAQNAHENKDNRDSQISTTSSSSNSSKLKQCIGPWRLGKTLGRGATARVRLARNIVTGQEAAVKIVQKNSAQLSQAGSLAALDRAEATLPIEVDGLRRMPIVIEREIAIMKLIQHPNIVSLYDIWENHLEIYIVLEYVDNGELFTHITSKGRLGEEEAMKCFRQMLSAVGYCHSFNICHRDLKPENILISKNGDIKIADFGMAALHQSPDHKLDTSCGSPHYAAPELISGSKYKGNMVDIWSMGVVLFATLAGRLPFDVDGNSRDWLPPLLAKIRKGQYHMPSHFSREASSLIWSMLQVNPENRIGLSQIWNHPLMQKYNYLDDLGGGRYPHSPSAKDFVRPILKRSEIQKGVVRYLRSMWHKLSEQEIIEALMSKEELFYTLLCKYQESILENYPGDLAYSTSDYHHVRPSRLTKTFSTCHFPQGKSSGHGHGRQISKFTVISNVAETEASYDPFKASRPQHLSGRGSVKITIHKSGSSTRESSSSARPCATLRPKSGTSSTTSSSAGKNNTLAPPSRLYASRSSIASSTRSRASAVRATVGHGKRGVSFNRLHRDSVSSLRDRGKLAINSRHSNFTEVTDDDGDILRPESTRYIRSRKPPVFVPDEKQKSLLWKDDVRRLSSSLARDCDVAFGNASLPKSNKHPEQKRNKIQGVNVTSTLPSFEDRPLPPAPERTASVKAELLQAREQAEYRKMYDNNDSASYLNRVVRHIDGLIQPGSIVGGAHDRRTTSAPVTETRHLGTEQLLPSIYEMGSESSSFELEQELLPLAERRRHGRIASAPEPSSVWETMHTLAENRYHDERPEFNPRKTIRAVPPSSPQSPIRPPAPLNIRKKGSGVDVQRHYRTVSQSLISPELERIDENNNPCDNESSHNSTGSVRKKPSSWFKRNSKSSSDSISTVRNDIVSPKVSQEHARDPYERPQNPVMASYSDPAPIPALAPKKKVSFNISKWLTKKRDWKPDMVLADDDIYEDDTSAHGSVTRQRSDNKGNAERDESCNRAVAPQRNWLAKLFNVKPAARYLCFSVPMKRARREITALFREWRRYGITDLQVDKERSIIFARVGAKNYFDMKEVAFAGEVMIVIDHSKRMSLSIARFTQERGAASSFNRVVDSLETVLAGKRLLVADKRTTKMMIKTLTSSS